MIYFFFGVITIVTSILIIGQFMKVYDPFVVTAIWFLFGSLPGLTYLIFRKPEKDLWKKFKKNKNHLLGYFLVSFISTIAFGFALKTIGVGTAAVVGQIQPLYLIAVGVLFFSEQFGRRELIASVITLSGLFLISYREDLTYNIGIVYALISVFGYGTQKIYNKLLSQKFSYAITVTIRAIVVSFAAFIFADKTELKEFIEVNNYQTFLCIIFGSLSGVYLNKIFDFKALETIPLSKFSLMSTCKPVLMFVLSIPILGESASMTKVFGSILILTGILTIPFREIKSPNLNEGS